jgi:hypothetical protein
MIRQNMADLCKIFNPHWPMVLLGRGEMTVMMREMIRCATLMCVAGLAAWPITAEAAGSRCKAWIEEVDGGADTVLRAMVDGPTGADIDYAWSVRSGGRAYKDSSVALLQGEPRQLNTSRVPKHQRDAEATLEVNGCGDPVVAKFRNK